MAEASDIWCTCRVCTKIRVTIDQIFSVLDVHGWLLNSYIVVRTTEIRSRNRNLYQTYFSRILYPTPTDACTLITITCVVRYFTRIVTSSNCTGFTFV